MKKFLLQGLNAMTILSLVFMSNIVLAQEKGLEQVCEQQVFVSEGGEDDTVAVSPTHEAWTASIGGAQWVWSENPIADPVNETIQTFTKTFTINGDPADSTLEIAADNSYKVSVNGNPLFQDSNEDNFSAEGQDSYTILAGDLVSGLNTIEFEVTNLAQAEGTVASNPAGLMYKITVNCTDAQEPQDPVCIEGNLITNGGFESPDVTNGSGWELFANETPNLGWAVSWVSPDGNAPVTANLELHGGVNGWLANEGSQYAELDTDYGTPAGGAASVMISQDIDTVEGIEYQLSYAFSARPDTAGGENVLKVYVDGNEVDAQGPTAGAGANAWTVYTVNFTAESNSTEIAFKDVGTPNSVGTFLDNVSVNCEYEIIDEPTDGDVTICKLNEKGDYLNGWKVSLFSDESSEQVKVYPNGSIVNSAAYPAGAYKLESNGTYVYRNHNGQGIFLDADAAYSYRIAEDEVNLGLDPNKFFEDTLWYKSTNGLGIRVDGTIPVWGNTFNPSHEYFYNTTKAIAGTFNFQITDDVYNDNSGYLTVDIYPGYEGVTEENGCVTFQNVPFGDYDLSEIMQDGWSYVSGSGEVTVDESQETFNIVNSQDDSNDDCTENCNNDDDCTQECDNDDEDCVTENCNQDNEEEVTPPSSNGGGSSSGSRRSGGGSVLGASTGEVLGACVPFSKYHSKGDVGGEVSKIQEFLNEQMGAGITVDGVYGDTTVKAVHAFQQKYFAEIITPWVPSFMARTTGKWYKTTRMMANELIACPEAPVFLEDPQIIYKVKWQPSN
mgnify:CR=1 FL=1